MRNDLKSLSLVLETELLLDQELVINSIETTCGELLDGSIYSMLSEEEIVSIESWQARELNEGSADVEDLKKLEQQAREYFKRPMYHPLKEKEVEYVTGFISLFSGFDSNGGLKFKGTGQKIQIPLNEVESVEVIRLAVEGCGFEFNELVQVKLYSPGLHCIVGSQVYQEGESKQFQAFSDEFSNVLFAIPSVEEVDDYLGDDSIYCKLDKLIQEEALYGYSAEEVLGKEGFAHWSVTKEFYESRLTEMLNEEKEFKKAQSLETARLEFQSKFKDEISWIQKLNSGEARVSDIMKVGDSHLVNRILYVSRSASFKESVKIRVVYDQLSSLAKFLDANGANNQHEVNLSDREKAIALIKRINAGNEIVVHELDPELVKSTVQLLWDHSAGYRIDYKFVQTYFQLKERFKALRTSSMAA